MEPGHLAKHSGKQKSLLIRLVWEATPAPRWLLYSAGDPTLGAPKCFASKTIPLSIYIMPQTVNHQEIRKMTKDELISKLAQIISDKTHPVDDSVRSAVENAWQQWQYKVWLNQTFAIVGWLIAILEFILLLI